MVDDVCGVWQVAFPFVSPVELLFVLLIDFMCIVVVFVDFFFKAIKLHFELLTGPVLSKIVHYYYSSHFYSAVSH